MEKRVVLGMSGGVDSSVAAYLLKKDGYEVIGVTLNQHSKDKNEDIEDAVEIAKTLGIKHIIINVYDDFKEKIIDYFIEGYNSGITPSPCPICDDEIKFKFLFEIADKNSIKYVATGHYTSVEYSEKFSKFLLKGIHDIRKDQSYMLYRLESSKLERLVFPLEKYTKQEIRNIALENGIKVHNKKDSQGICFAKEGYKEFLKKNLKEKIIPGNYIDKEGNILGVHEGYQYYTLGQRHGLGINFSKPMFITAINVENNEIMLGKYDELLVDKVELINSKFNVKIDFLLNLELLARPRFSSQGFKGYLEIKNNKVYFKYIEKNTHNSDGQHLVIFYKNFVLGGGIIRR